MSTTEDMNIANNVRIIRNKVIGTDISEMNIAANVKEIADNYDGSSGGGGDGTTYSFKSNKGLDVSTTGTTTNKTVTYSLKDDIYNTVINIPKLGGIIYFTSDETLSNNEEITSDKRRKISYSLSPTYKDKINKSIQSIKAGTNIEVDNSNPVNPIINCTLSDGDTSWKNSKIVGNKYSNGFSIIFNRGDGSYTDTSRILFKTINDYNIIGEGNLQIDGDIRWQRSTFVVNYFPEDKTLRSILDRGDGSVYINTQSVKTINNEDIFGEGNIEIGGSSQNIIFNTDGNYSNIKDEVIDNKRNVTYSLTTIGDNLLDDLNKYGFSRWYPSTYYNLGSLVTKRNGKIYQSLVDNNNSDPENIKYWKEVNFDGSSKEKNYTFKYGTGLKLDIDNTDPDNPSITYSVSDETKSIIDTSNSVNNKLLNPENIQDGYVLTYTDKDKIIWKPSGGMDEKYLNDTFIKRIDSNIFSKGIVDNYNIDLIFPSDFKDTIKDGTIICFTVNDYNNISSTKGCLLNILNSDSSTFTRQVYKSSRDGPIGIASRDLKPNNTIYVCTYSTTMNNNAGGWLLLYNFSSDDLRNLAFLDKVKKEQFETINTYKYGKTLTLDEDGNFAYTSKSQGFFFVNGTVLPNYIEVRSNTFFQEDIVDGTAIALTVNKSVGDNQKIRVLPLAQDVPIQVLDTQTSTLRNIKAGEMIADGVYILFAKMDNGLISYWNLINPFKKEDNSSSSSYTPLYGDANSINNVNYTLNLNPPFTGNYTNGFTVTIKALSQCLNNPTLKINSKANVPIYTNDGNPAKSGDMNGYGIYQLMWSNNYNYPTGAFMLLNPSNNSLVNVGI